MDDEADRNGSKAVQALEIGRANENRARDYLALTNRFVTFQTKPLMKWKEFALCRHVLGSRGAGALACYMLKCAWARMGGESAIATGVPGGLGPLIFIMGVKMK